MKYAINTTTVVLFLLFSNWTFAQQLSDETADSAAPAGTPDPKAVKPKRIQFDAQNAVKVNYGAPNWNPDPKRIDSGAALIREGTSGRIVQVRLEETEPDSGIFSGQYSVHWQDIDKNHVEFYVPEQSLIEKPSELGKYIKLIKDKKILRKPFILRKDANGMQNVELFDTREQAQKAYQAVVAQQLQLLQQQQQLQLAKQQQPQIPQAKAATGPSEADLEAARQREAELERQRAMQNLAERIRLEQFETKRIALLKQKFDLLKPEDKDASRKKAAELARQALSDYQKGNYKAAEDKFDDAVEADPYNKEFYFQHAVSLYKTEHHNRSLVYLDLADGPGINQVEKDYFRGLNQFKLKELVPAYDTFGKVEVAKDKVMSPSAAFYRGLIKFEEKNYDLAQIHFQLVIDTADDPMLDQRAEQYLEQCLKQKQLEEERKRKWLLTATLGEMFDSNVTLSSDSSRDQGSASNYDGYRTLFSGSVNYRSVYEQTREVAFQLDVVATSTVDKSFQNKTELADADAQIYTFTVPLTFKWFWGQTSVKSDIVPGWEGTNMSVENHTNKMILSSYLLNMNNLLVVSQNRLTYFNLEVRKDESKLTSSTGDDDASALKTKFAWNNIFFVSDEKNRIVTADTALTMNTAQGKNSTYQRLDAAVGYIRPWLWDTTANLKLGMYYLTYPQKAAARNDLDYALTAGFSRKINDALSWGAMGSYTLNSSNVDSYKYNKYIVLFSITGTTRF